MHKKYSNENDEWPKLSVNEKNPEDRRWIGINEEKLHAYET